MDYEKKYKEALERAKEIMECSKNSDSKEVRMVLSFFPELKESEDEKIRKGILSALKYLETELSWDALGEVDILDAYDWLENIKNRILPIQPQREWSEEDEKKLDAVCFHLTDHCDTVGEYRSSELADWLKALSPQPKWKPSEKQMKALWDSIPENVMEISEREMLLDSLYQDLKKLTE